MSYQVALTLKSQNAKTGPIPTSMTTAETCPTACPLSAANATPDIDKGGCYAEQGHVAMHWRKVTRRERGTDWATFCRAVDALPHGQLWRHNVAGDLPTTDRVTIDADAMTKLVEANVWRRGFTYTHHDVVDNAWNAMVVKWANEDGFTVNLSANDPAHADELADLAIAPVVTLLPADVHGRQDLHTPAGRRIVVCPATYRDDTTCASCGLCQVATRNVVVGFPAHGSQARKASAVASRTRFVRSHNGGVA